MNDTRATAPSLCVYIRAPFFPEGRACLPLSTEGRRLYGGPQRRLFVDHDVFLSQRRSAQKFLEYCRQLDDRSSVEFGG